MTLNIRAYRSNLSRRLGPVFAEAALEAQQGPKTGQEVVEIPTHASPAKAYKHAHGGYPTVIPMAWWHQAANDAHYGGPPSAV